MTNIQLEINAREFFRKMDRVETDLIPYMAISLERFAEMARDMLRKDTPRASKGDAHIADLWVFQKDMQAAITTYEVFNLSENQDLLKWLEEGTVAHFIFPKKPGGVLRFIDEATGEDIYAKYVVHPGTKAYRMVENTRQAIQSRIDEYIQTTLSTGMKLLDK